MEVMIRTNTGYWPVLTDGDHYQWVFGRYDADVELSNGRRAALVRVYLNDTNNNYPDLRNVPIFIAGVEPNNDDTCCINVEGEGSKYISWKDFTQEAKPYIDRRPALPMGKEPWDIAIDADPLDWALRAVYADWLEDFCPWLMKGQRFQIQHKLTPGPACVQEAAWHEATWFAPWQAGGKWCMFGGKAVSVKDEWCVPKEVFDKLSGHILQRRDGGSHNHFAKSWNGRREAEIALALALETTNANA